MDDSSSSTAVVPAVGHDRVVEANNSNELWAVEKSVSPSTVVVARLPRSPQDPQEEGLVGAEDVHTVSLVGDDDETPVSELNDVGHAVHRQWPARSFSPDCEGLHGNGVGVSYGWSVSPPSLLLFVSVW